MGNALDSIRYTVRVIVRRVDAPLGSGLMMLYVSDTIEYRVAHIDVG